LYLSGKENKYIITYNSLKTFDNGPWINLEDRQISNLTKLLQEHEALLEKNKANLSEREVKVIQFKSKEQKEAEERFKHLSDHLFPPTKQKTIPEIQHKSLT